MNVEEHFRGTPVCFVSFASMGEGDPQGCHFEWRKTLHDELDTSVVLIRDPEYQWYQGGIGGIGDIAASVDYVRCLKARCERLVTLGVSMGGFGALLFGILAGADEIIALVPQTVLGHDPRWRDNWPHIKQMPHPDIATLLPCNSKIRVFIGDGDHAELDHGHYDRLGDHAELTIIKDCDHSGIARRMRDDGFFASYAR